jgi:trehalose-6-phosphate synthase
VADDSCGYCASKSCARHLEAFRHALICFPELQRRVTLVQAVVPSRMDIPAYDDLKAQIERLVGEINGQFTQLGAAEGRAAGQPL